MDFDMNIEVWATDQLSPGRVITLNIPGEEFRIHLRDGNRKIGHFTVFRGNEPRGPRSPVSVDFVPSDEQSERRKEA